MASLTDDTVVVQALRRRPSEVALAELTATRIVCDAWPLPLRDARVAHTPDEEEEEGDDGEIASALEVCPPVNSSSPTSRCDSRPPEAIDSATTAALASSSSSSSSDDYAVCSSCEVCNEVQTTWRTLLKYAFGISLSTGLSYILWLRFIASRETVRKHVFTAARILGERLFNYSVLDSKKIPTTGPALLTVYASISSSSTAKHSSSSSTLPPHSHTLHPLTHRYHGFIPVDMYFLHEYIHRVTGRLPTTLAADFMFKIPIWGYLCRACGCARKPSERVRGLKEGRPRHGGTGWCA